MILLLFLIYVIAVSSKKFSDLSAQNLADDASYSLQNYGTATIGLSDTDTTFSHISITDVSNAIIIIKGRIYLDDSGGEAASDGAFFHFVGCHNLTIRGGGTVDGQGFTYWQAVNNGGEDSRPSMFLIEESVGLTIESLNLRNSPKYFIDIKDVQTVIIRWCNIDTSIFDPDSASITYPLNTDGINIAATDVLIHDLTIKSHDDAIAIKPCHLYYKYCTCSSNMFINNIAIVYSTGLAIGSITPQPWFNCIRNITFDKISLKQPYKSIYLKTSPNSEYSLNSDMISASVSGVTFKNIRIKSPIWWVIYLGPQQMEASDCRLANDNCYTVPQVTFSDISFIDVKATNVISYTNSPGVMQCSINNPCTDIMFRRVSIRPPSIKSSIRLKTDLFLCLRAKNDDTKLSNLNEDQLVVCMFHLLLGRDLASSVETWKYLQNYTSGTAYDSYPSPANFVIITTPIWKRYKLGKIVAITAIIACTFAVIFVGCVVLIKRFRNRKECSRFKSDLKVPPYQQL